MTKQEAKEMTRRIMRNDGIFYFWTAGAVQQADKTYAVEVYDSYSGNRETLYSVGDLEALRQAWC
jgi:hypothetical protein